MVYNGVTKSRVSQRTYIDIYGIARRCETLREELFFLFSRWILLKLIKMTPVFVLICIGQREPTIDAILIHRACPPTCNDIIGSRPRLPLVSSAPAACSVRHNFSGMLHSARCCSAALTFHLFLSRYAVGMPRNITYLPAAWPIYMRKSSSFDGYWSRRGRMRGHKVAGCT